MELCCVGLSHRTAPLAVRERLGLPVEAQAEVLGALTTPAQEAMVLNTCNRAEMYVATGASDAAVAAIRAEIVRRAGPEALDHLYELRGEAALVHLFRVSASLDSMVVGEPQILGQVKDAFELAQRQGAARAELSRACAAAFSSAKRVRSETAIGRAATSMASAAVSLAKKIFGELDGTTALIVGAGEMAELAARHLKTAGASQLVICNRTLDRAIELAAQVGGTARPFEELLPLVVPADVVISSTASPSPLFTREKLAPLMRARRFRRLLMVDLAVPRDIAPDVNTLENVYTADVDDIQEMLAENSAARAAEATRAEKIIAEEVARFARSKAVRDGVPVLAQLRARAEQIKRAELDRTLANLRPGLSEEELRRTVEALANALVNKLLHQPTAKLRAVGPEEGKNSLAGAAAELFGLELPGEGTPAAPSAAVPSPAAEAPGAVAPRATGGVKR